jgi:hypothetical protein
MLLQYCVLFRISFQQLLWKISYLISGTSFIQDFVELVDKFIYLNCRVKGEPFSQETYF